ncbi:hypothetical protein ACMBCM_08355 [Spiroplasma sp. K1]
MKKTTKITLIKTYSNKNITLLYSKLYFQLIYIYIYIYIWTTV